jgi:hypothetical protein
MTELKRCPKCGETKEAIDFGYRSGARSTQLNGLCKLCLRLYHQRWSVIHPGYQSYMDHETGRHKSMQNNIDCTMHLGVYIVENTIANDILHKIFSNVSHNESSRSAGFDYLCDDIKIDVKSSCLHKYNHTHPLWVFGIDKNNIPDYFLCIVVNNIQDITVVKSWMIPSELINNRSTLSITNSIKILNKWSQYEV